MRNASRKSQVVKELSVKKEASPNMVDVHFRGKNNLVHILFTKAIIFLHIEIVARDVQML